MKHIIFTRIRFNDKELMEKYLKITKDVLIPSLNSQTNKNFEWILLVRQEDVEYLTEQLDFPFIPVYNIDMFIEYVKTNNINIQTRHDCDDWMSPDYVKVIQENYEKNIGKFDKFLVQSQPIQRMYKSRETKKLSLYHKLRCSMHLSLCQKNVVNHINEKQHGQMYQITPNVISLGEGYTEWVIHGDNITIKRGNFKKNN